MQKVVILLALFAVTSMASSLDKATLNGLWKFWKNRHEKIYGIAEEAERFAIFVENYNHIINYNTKNDKVKLGLNKFADLTPEEFKALYIRGHQEDAKFQRTLNLNTYGNQRNLQDLPASVDWRQKGAVTPVKDEGSFGAGYGVFTTVGTLESFYFINTGQLISFSEQQVQDCDIDDNEGLPIFTYYAKNGIEPEADYPSYPHAITTCQYDSSKAIYVNTGLSSIQANSVLALKTAIVAQPVSIFIEADQDIIQFYTSGVISTNCGAELNHGGVAVGYDTIDGEEAFIVKNSWGTSWGDQGYIHISTDGSQNYGAGVCGILKSPVIPVHY